MLRPPTMKRVTNIMPQRPEEPRDFKSPKRTPNSGVTPIRPDKSPGLKPRSKLGITPIRPTKSPATKSPFSGRPKPKCGILPIRPNFVNNPNASIVFGGDLSSANKRRKTTMVPLVSQNFGLNSSMTASNPFSIPNSRLSMGSCASTIQRRKSGILPIRPITTASALPLKKSIPNSVTQLRVNSQIAVKGNTFSNKTLVEEPDEADPLNTIKEENEALEGTKCNESGINRLDDTVDLLNVITVKTAEKKVSLSSKGTNTSSQTKSRIPRRRALQFNDCETDKKEQTNVLRDSTSKLNCATPKRSKNCVTFKLKPRSSLENKPRKSAQKQILQVSITNNREIERAELLRKKKELLEQVDEVEKQLRLLDLKENEKPKEHNGIGVEQNGDNDIISPFSDISSPVIVATLELAPREKGKQPENIYKVFRKSCSFLMTPQPSAFKKDTIDVNEDSETPNVSRRLQKQLAVLFDE